MWKCSTAFVLGAATHYLISTYLSNEKRNEIWESVRSAKSSNYTGSSAPSSTDASEHTPGDDMAASKEIASESSEDNDWEGKDSSLWQPQKMVLCVRTDLGMGKGRMLIFIMLRLYSAYEAISYGTKRKNCCTMLSCNSGCI